MAIEVLRPDGTGDNIGTPFSNPFGVQNYTLINEAVADEGAGSISTFSGTALEAFSLQNTGLAGSSVISFITVNARAEDAGGTKSVLFLGLRFIGVTGLSGPKSLPQDNFADVSYIFSTNVATGLSWIVSDLNSLQLVLRGDPSAGEGMVVTQAYVEVNYTAGAATFGILPQSRPLRIWRP